MTYRQACRRAHQQRRETGQEYLVYRDWEWHTFRVCPLEDYEQHDPDLQEIKQEEACYSTLEGPFPVPTTD